MTKARQSPPGGREMSPVHADRGGDHRYSHNDGHALIRLNSPAAEPPHP